MSKWIRSLCLIVLIAALAAIPASAQDGAFGLSAADLQQLGAANDNSTSKDQFTFDYSVGLTVNGVGFPITAALSGTGSLDVINGVGNLTMTGDAGGTPIEGEIRIVGDLLYARATNPLDGTDTGWFSFNVVELMDAQPDLGSFGGDMSAAFLEGFAEGAGVSQDDFDTAAFQSMLLALTAVDPESFIGITRSDKGAQSVFTVDISLSDLFRTPEMVPVAEQFLIASAISPATTTTEASAFNGVLADVLTQTVISLDQVINTESNLVDSASFLLDSTVDPAAIGEAGEVISVNFTLDVNLTSYDQPANVIAPPGAVEIPSSLIIDALGVEAGTGGGVDSGSTGSEATSGGMVSLTCESSADMFEGGPGTSFSGTCPANCMGSLWGTDSYTDDSSICTAAVHAGAIPASGGDVTFVIGPEGDNFPGSAQNGITSSEWTSFWGRTFSFGAAVSGNMSSGGDASMVSLDCSSAAQDFEGPTGTSFTGLCPANCTGSLWGTDVYTDDSSICTAAVHAGAVPASGGEVTFVIMDGMDGGYTSTAQNGITSSEWSAFWGRSFGFNSGGMSSDGSGNTTASATTSFANTFSFGSGLTFGYPDNYEILSDTEVVTIVWIPNTATFVQVYDLASLFGDVDFGLDFYKETYGGAAAQAWGFEFNIADFQEMNIDGATYHVLPFTGTQNGEATSGQVILIPLADGGYTYVQSYTIGAPPANFDADTFAIAQSVTG